MKLEITTILYSKSRRISSINDLPRDCTGLKLSGIATYISDGDGFHFFHVPLFRSSKPSSSSKLKIRLAGIDAPETRYFNIPAQPLSQESKLFLSSLILNKTVYLEILGVDRYSRILAIVFLDSININIEMIKKGYACVYKGRDGVYGKYKDKMIINEKESIKRKKGIWGLKDMILPMDYKKQTKYSIN
ncbi:putative endonuclease LCL3 [Vairimorpha necatrix]|uniref:Endonuclease LCL3 n=1 Tax=Vairimorpha necatrix TaxID=6039 RepID=A0AAX4JAT5_9MICR